jgi:hypothetical protein
LEYREKRRLRGGNGSEESGYRAADKPIDVGAVFQSNLVHGIKGFSGVKLLGQVSHSRNKQMRELISCSVARFFAAITVYKVALEHGAHINRLRRIQSSARDPLLKLGDVEGFTRLFPKRGFNNLCVSAYRFTASTINSDPCVPGLKFHLWWTTNHDRDGRSMNINAESAYPSSSRWASTYVHLGELADNRGARVDVSQVLVYSRWKIG